MIYQLGEHVIAQGDSTDPEFVSRVIQWTRKTTNCRIWKSEPWFL